MNPFSDLPHWVTVPLYPSRFSIPAMLGAFGLLSIVALAVDTAQAGDTCPCHAGRTHVSLPAEK